MSQIINNITKQNIFKKKRNNNEESDLINKKELKSKSSLKKENKDKLLNSKRLSSRLRNKDKSIIYNEKELLKKTLHANNTKASINNINNKNKDEIVNNLLNELGLKEEDSTIPEDCSYSDIETHLIKKEYKNNKMNPLKFKIHKNYKFKARASTLTLPHGKVQTPIFMPVGTKAAMKGLLSCDLERMKCMLCLANTYHLTLQPGDDLIFKGYEGTHNFMNWKRNLLTDSGGFQMVSLIDNALFTEEGVEFSSHIKGDNRRLMLTPEKSIEIQNNLGSDIIMMLDDVVRPNSDNIRIKDACERTIRWLDRCILAHKNPETQNLFPIVQGGLDLELRKWCIKEMIKRDQPGYAIGGLAGGESKDDFWKVVNVSCQYLPYNKPRYLMGVGYPIDLIVCSLLGVDMFDCVFPTRTARFGNAFTNYGIISLEKSCYKYDFNPIDDECDCEVCKTYTRSYFYVISSKNPRSCSLISYHNLYYLLRLMSRFRKSIMDHKIQEFVEDFFMKQFKHLNKESCLKYIWVLDALKAAEIDTEKIKKLLDGLK